MRLPTWLAVLVALGVLLPLPLGLRRAEAGSAITRSDVLPLEQVHRGMKGYGLTVFQGTKPERFDVEVIDVLKNFRPRQDLILIKTKHPRLEVAKVVAGMSGSPIYLNDKMVGAYAYGWTFGAEPVAGVTPIQNMLQDLVRPLPDKIDGWPLRVLPPGGKLASNELTLPRPNRGLGDPTRYDLREHASQVAAQRAVTQPSDTPLRPVATPLLVGGLTSGAVALAKDLLGPLGLEPLQAGGGGGTEPDAPRRYEDGGAIGVQLIRGDMSAMGLGTVTRVEGDRLVAFGHPMMESGVTALPTAIGKVLWFLASDMRSFKIGMPVRDVGALVNDRQASIVVSHGAKAPVIPVSMRIRGVPGLPNANWNFQIAHEKFMTPSFVAVALGSALQAIANERQDISWTAVSKLSVKDYGTLTLEDFGVAVGGTPEPGEFSRSNLVRAVGAIMNNPWKPAFIEGVSMDIELRYSREILRLRGAESLAPEVDAGQPAKLRLTFQPFSGPEVTRVVSVPIPAHLAGQTLTLEITPGYSEEPETAPPDTLEAMIRNLEAQTYPPKSVVVSFSTGSPAVSFRGLVAKNLPPSALDALRPTTSSVGPDAFQSNARLVVPLSEFMVGRDKVSVKVRPVLR
ncbi:MAG: hypothetical protein M3020_07685 [Myxococcota bacterium]|nr:hypothetical protein [Myxococcota bacterium]